LAEVASGHGAGPECRVNWSTVNAAGRLMDALGALTTTSTSDKRLSGVLKAR